MGNLCKNTSLENVYSFSFSVYSGKCLIFTGVYFFPAWCDKTLFPFIYYQGQIKTNEEWVNEWIKSLFILEKYHKYHYIIKILKPQRMD